MRNGRIRPFKKWLRITAAFLSALIFLSACSSGKQNQEAPSLVEPVGAAIDTEIVQRGELVVYSHYTGPIEAKVTELYYEVDGVVGEVYVYPGQYVEEGDILMTLDQSSVENSIASLKKSIEEKTKNGEYEDRISDLNIEIMQIDLAEIKDTLGSDSRSYKMKPWISKTLFWIKRRSRKPGKEK